MKSLSGGMKVAVLIILLIFIYFGILIFYPIKPANKDQVVNTSSYLQTILTILITYYWGSSSKWKHPDQSSIDEGAKEEAAKLEIERIEAAKKDAEKVEALRIDTAKKVAEEVITTASTESQINEGETK